MTDITVLQLRQAGFSDEHILRFVNGNRDSLKQAGFSDNEINSHYGISPTSWDMFKATDFMPQEEVLKKVGVGQTIKDIPEINSTLADRTVEKGSGLDVEGQVLKPDNSLVNAQVNAGESTADKIIEGSEPPITKTGDEVVLPDANNTPTFNNELAENIAKAEENKMPRYEWAQLDNSQKMQLKVGGGFFINKEDGTRERILGKYVAYPDSKDPTMTGLTAAEREANEDKLPVLNTLITTGPDTLRIIEGIRKKNPHYTDFQLDSINEAMSFVAAIESDNRNIYNEKGTKGGVFQIHQDEMMSLLNRYVLLSKDLEEGFVKPSWVDEAYQHKSATKLPIDAQRALMLTKLFTPTKSRFDDGEYSDTGKYEYNEFDETEREQLKKLQINLINTSIAYANATDEQEKRAQAFEQKVEAILAESPITPQEVQDQQVRLAKAEADLQHLLNQFNELGKRVGNIKEIQFDIPEDGDIEAIFNKLSIEQRTAIFERIRKDKRVPNEDALSIADRIAKGDKEAIKEFYLKYHNPPTEGQDIEKLNARVDEYLSTWNTTGYKYSLPEMATWNEGGAVTEFLQDSYAGRKFIMYTGGSGEQNVFGNGMAMSVSGLMSAYHTEIINGKDPKEAYEEIFMHQTQNFGQDLVQSLSMIVGDTPWMGAGCIAAVAPPSAALLTPAAPMVAPTLPFFCAAGAFALPESLRDTYVRSLMNGNTNNWNEFTDEFLSAKTAKTAAKYGTVGAVTLGVGKGVQAMGGGRLLQLSAEIPTMVTLSAVLNGQVPTRHDFAHAAVLMFGIHGAIKGTGQLYNIYKKYGVHPRDVVTLGEKRADIKTDLMNGKEPTYFEETGQALTQAAEEITGTKLVPPPKVEINETINVGKNGTETGQVVGREQKNGIEVILEIEKPNGERVKIPEHEVTMADNTPITVVIDTQGKIRIESQVDGQFEARKSAGEFSNDVNSPRTFPEVKSTTEVVSEVVSREKIDSRVTSKDAVATNEVFVNRKAYPDIAREIDGQLPKVTRKAKNQTDILRTEFDRNPAMKANKADVVFEVEANGTNGFKSDMVVIRSQDGYLAVPRVAFDSLLRHVDDKGAQSQAAFVVEGTNVLFLHGKDGTIIGGMKGEKVTGRLEAEAQSYYTNHRSQGQNTFYDKHRSSKGGNEWGAPNEPPPPNTPKTGMWHDIMNTGLDTFDLVELVRVLTTNTPILSRMPPKYRGYFQHGKIVNGVAKALTKEEVVVAVNRALAENPKEFTMTLAHEIGHLIDYLPQETMNKGNILGSLGALKNYLNQWIDGKADGAKPLTKIEIDIMRKEAEAIAAKNEKKVDVEIETELKVTPQMILDIWRDPEIRSKIPPEVYDAVARLSSALKKEVTRDAIRGLISKHIQVVVDAANKKKVDPVSLAEANEILARNIEMEIKRRGLVNREEVTAELVELSQKWKPFDRNYDPAYTQYRDSPRELMADFMMAVLLRPNWTKVNAPTSWSLLMNHFYKRPEVKAQFIKVQNEIAAGGDARFSPVHNRVMDMFRETEAAISEKMINEWNPNKTDAVHAEFIDSFAWFYRRFGGPNGWWTKNTDGRNTRWMDKDTLNLNWRIENFRYRHAYMQRYMNDMMERVVKPIENMGYNVHTLATMLLYRNLAQSTQRGNKANPLGLWSQLKERGLDGDIINQIEGERSAMAIYENFAKLHPELDAAATKFFELRKEYMMPVIKESKAFDAETIDIILNNDQYVTFSVGKWVEERIGKYGNSAFATAAIKKTEGTLSDIMNPFTATMEKDLLLLTSLKKNRLMLDAIQWMQKNKDWIERFDAESLGGNGKDVVIKKATMVGAGEPAPAPRGMALVSVLVEGKLQHYHMNKYAADAFLANPYRWMMGISFLQSTNNFFRSVFTEYNPLFWAKNQFRDVNRAVRNLPNARYFDIVKGGNSGNRRMGQNAYLKYYFKSFKPAWKSVFGEGTELTRWMEKEGFLIAQMEGYRGKAGLDAIKQSVKEGRIDPDNFVVEAMMQKMSAKQYETYYNKTMGRLLDYVGNIARMLERTHKIAGTQYLKDAIERGDISMSTKEMMLKIQADVGSPNFLRTGRMHPVMNNLLLFSNAMKEGIRGDYVRLREDPVSVSSKFMAYNVAPKVMQKMLKYGVIGGTVGAYYTTFFGGVSEYDEQNYIIIPLGYTAAGKPIYFRIPQDETARMVNGIIGRTLDTTLGQKSSTIIAQGLSGDVTPSLAPIIPLLKNVYDMLNGHNPIDGFTNEYAIDKDTWEAKDARTLQASLQYVWNSYGGGSYYRFKTDDPTKIAGELEQILGYPVLGTFANTFLKVGKHPIKGDWANNVNPQTLIDKSRASLDYKQGIAKLISGGEDLTEAEFKAVAIKAESLKHDKTMLSFLAMRTGSTELVQMLLTTTDKAELAYLMVKIDEFAKKNPDFPLFKVRE